MKDLIAKRANVNTAAYGCELIIKTKTAAAPSISETVVLLFNQTAH